jgi:hypothetical protein
LWDLRKRQISDFVYNVVEAKFKFGKGLLSERPRDFVLKVGVPVAGC